MVQTLILTRPEAQSRALAARLTAPAEVIIAPIMEISATGEAPELSVYAGVILTSANAQPFSPDITGVTVHCVGSRTAEAARAAGARIGVVAANADDLVARVTGPGPLLHLRGEHVRGAIAQRLNSAGIVTEEAVVYRQKALPLSAPAKAAIEGGGTVVLPLYSPRSARLVGEAVARVGESVRVIAMSAAVAEAWHAATGGTAEVCAEPTGADMQLRIETALRGRVTL